MKSALLYLIPSQARKGGERLTTTSVLWSFIGRMWFACEGGGRVKKCSDARVASDESKVSR